MIKSESNSAVPEADGSSPVFWSFRRCPYAMRARLALQSAGITVRLREILLRDKPDAFLATSPKGTVPVMDLGDGQIIEESLEIMIWSLSRHDPEGWLDVTRRTPQASAAFLEQLDGPFKTHLDRYKYASRYDPKATAFHRAEGASILAEFETLLARATGLSGAACLSGARPGLLDFASLPFVRQFRIADPHWFDAQPWPHLHQWLQAFLDSERFSAVMDKYAPWQPDDEGVVFPVPTQVEGSAG